MVSLDTDRVANDAPASFKVCDVSIIMMIRVLVVTRREQWYNKVKGYVGFEGDNRSSHRPEWRCLRT
jgi:hypothetical protein